jgi:hypothetical protein
MPGWLFSPSSYGPSDDEAEILLRIALRQLGDQVPKNDIWERLRYQIIAAAHSGPRSHAHRPPVESRDAEGRFTGGNPFWGLSLRPVAPGI